MTKLKNSAKNFQKFKELEGILTLDEKRSQELEVISNLHAGYLTARASRTIKERVDFTEQIWRKVNQNEGGYSLWRYGYAVT